MPLQRFEPTSISSWGFSMARALRTYGIDPHALFNDAGISLRDKPSPYLRYPVKKMQNVWRDAYLATDDDFGFSIAQFLTPSSFYALGFGLCASVSLLDMFHRLQRYRYVISHQFDILLNEQDDELKVSLVDQRDVRTNVTTDVLFVYVVSLARQISGKHISPTSISLTRNPRSYPAKLIDFMGIEIDFNEADNATSFSLEKVTEPLIDGDTYLAYKQDQIVEQYMAQMNLIDDIKGKVRVEILKALEDCTVSIKTIASQLNVTPRTLQRHLSAEGTSYYEQLDHIRNELALDYAKDMHLRVTDIAFRLGFSDSQSFTRSFKRWTGQTLTDYRAGIADNMDDFTQ